MWRHGYTTRFFVVEKEPRFARFENRVGALRVIGGGRVRNSRAVPLRLNEILARDRRPRCGPPYCDLLTL